jgi:putative ABC transport system ATP-binding protein
VKKGDFISIMGPSGSGKSTLLNLIGALDSPTEGEIYINGQNLKKLNDVALTRLRRHEIGFIFQFYNLIPVLTCRENIELPLISVGMKKNERKERVLDLIHKVGLEKHLNHKPNQLSGGQQQRVAIARALVNRPSIVLADEPTGDLDTTTGDKVINYLKLINELEEQSIIIVTHDFNIADRTDKIYQILDGVFIN